MYSSDVSRLTYIIRESCKKGKNVWSYDKKGAKTKKIIIEPALQYIRNKLLEFCRDNGGSTDIYSLKHMTAAVSIMGLIDSGELATDIVKYIAPEFTVEYLDNDHLTIEA